MEVGQGPNWGCRAKEKKMFISTSESNFRNLSSLFIIFFHYPHFTANIPSHILAYIKKQASVT
jgi:hypothetical protein